MQNIKIAWQGAVIFSLFTGFISLKLKEKDEELPTIESEEFSKNRRKHKKWCSPVLPIYQH